MTCLWMAPYLTRFLRGDQKTLAISGKPGSGKTVLSSVIIGNLEQTIRGVHYSAIYVSISKYCCSR